QAAHLGQDHLGGAGEAVQGAGPGSPLGRTAGQVAGVQAEGGVAGAGAVMAVRAMVVGPFDGQGAQGREQALSSIALEARRSPAVGAAQAGASVPPFFRCRAAVWRARAPRRWTRSRSWNSVAPKSRSSGLLASNSAMARRSCSVEALSDSRSCSARRACS